MSERDLRRVVVRDDRDNVEQFPPHCTVRADIG